MQLELGVVAAPEASAGAAPRILALCVPDLSLQRVQRARAMAAVERRAAVPLAVEREGRILSCDPEARARGVRPGDPVAQACAACADLEVVPADVAADRAILESLAEALLALAPCVELASPDALLVDASGAHLLAPDGPGGELELLRRANALAGELGLRCRTALANGRAPARALARHGGGATPVAPAALGEALAGLPLEALELAAPLAKRFAAVGLRTAGDLARIPADTLAHRFGVAGVAAWRLARGDDPTPLVPFVPTRLPEERVELDAPVDRAEPLLFVLKRMSDLLATRLAGRGLGATRLQLRLRLDPAGEERLDVALAVPSCAATRWLLVLRERLAELRLPGSVVALALIVAQGAPAAPEQLVAGDRPDRLLALETVLARLQARLGHGALFAATPADRHRPEAAYLPAAFEPPPRAEPARGDVEIDRGALPDRAERPTRLLARPQALVALGEGGRLTALRLAGRTLRVLALSPAERLAGEWWSDPFDRDYHRATLEGLGDCWIYRDAGDGRLWLHGFFD
jgi:protein ImuB